MNFTSQICTTKEQSEILLALGLKKETADMAYEYKPKHLADTDIDKDWVIVAHSPCGTDIPAWSLHRLIEILDIWYLELDFHNFANTYEQVISYFEERVKGGFINKEYLEKL